jgi:hypothetical protein
MNLADLPAGTCCVDLNGPFPTCDDHDRIFRFSSHMARIWRFAAELGR